MSGSRFPLQTDLVNSCRVFGTVNKDDYRYLRCEWGHYLLASSLGHVALWTNRWNVIGAVSLGECQRPARLGRQVRHKVRTGPWDLCSWNWELRGSRLQTLSHVKYAIFGHCACIWNRCHWLWEERLCWRHDDKELRLAGRAVLRHKTDKAGNLFLAGRLWAHRQ